MDRLWSCIVSVTTSYIQFSKKSELAVTYNTVDKLKTHPDIQTFIKWVAKKDPYFYTSPKSKTGKTRDEKGTHLGALFVFN
jgi:hypothetical protein